MKGDRGYRGESEESMDEQGSSKRGESGHIRTVAILQKVLYGKALCMTLCRCSKLNYANNFHTLEQYCGPPRLHSITKAVCHHLIFRVLTRLHPILHNWCSNCTGSVL